MEDPPGARPSPVVWFLKWARHKVVGARARAWTEEQASRLRRACIANIFLTEWMWAAREKEESNVTVRFWLEQLAGCCVLQ